MGKRTTCITMAGLTLGGLLLMGLPAGAQTDDNPYIDQREANQQHRIHQGIHAGALTPGEARYLEREQARIQAAEDRMGADGRFSPWERHRLNQMQNHAGRDIHRLKQNHRNAPDWNGPNHSGWGRPAHPGWHNGHHYGWQRGNHGGNGHHYGWHNPQHRGWGGQAQHPGYGPGNGPQPPRFHQGNHFGGQRGWQRPPSFQPARQSMAPNLMRPHGQMMTRQPGGFSGAVNRAGFSPQRRR